MDSDNSNLDFTKGTIYKDLRKLGHNAYRDIKISLSMGTTSDLVHYLKDHSGLLKGYDGNESVTSLAKGSFSHVYLIEDHNGRQLVIKRSHDGWIPIQLRENFYISFPQPLAKIVFPNYGITRETLERDVYDYEEILAPYWGKQRIKLEGELFMPYLNMALYMVDQFMPDFDREDLYKPRFWNKLLTQKRHKYLSLLQKYLRKIPTQEQLIPYEERYIFYDKYSQALQTVFIQEAIRGKEDVIPDEKMAFPFELVAAGVIPPEMPKLMIEQILRSTESFVRQLQDKRIKVLKVPDYRPLESWKAFPPSPYEFYFAETSNLVVYKQKNKRINISLVDTHLLLEPENNYVYNWLEKRYWISLFSNLRFWVRKALDAIN